MLVFTEEKERSYNRRSEAARKNFENILKSLPRKQREKIYDMIASAQRVSKELRTQRLRSDLQADRVG